MAAIDVGQSCSNFTNTVAPGYTRVEKDNPANLSGTIDYCCIHSNSAMSGIEMASFAHEGSNVLSTNGTAGLANQGSAGLTEYNAPGDFTAFDINAGEYLGFYCTGGLLDRADSGGSGHWYHYGDAIPASSDSFGAFANMKMSIYATGNTISPGGRTPLPLINGGLINNGLISGGLIS